MAGLLVLVNVPKHRKNNIAQTPISAAASVSVPGGNIVDGGNIVVLGRFTYGGKGPSPPSFCYGCPMLVMQQTPLEGDIRPRTAQVSDVWHSLISGSDSFHESVRVDEAEEFFIFNTTEVAGGHKW